MYKENDKRTLQKMKRRANEELIKPLVKLSKELGRVPKMKDLKVAEDMPSTNTYVKYFGSWNKALEAAGFKPNVRHGWTEEELIELLVGLSEKLGRIPTMRDVNATEDMPSFNVYRRFFGSWNKALEAAGFKPNVRHGWTRGELIELLVKLGKKLGRIPMVRDVGAAEDMPSSDTYREYFGSWNKALEAAGFKPNVRHDWTEEKLIELLVKLGKKLGRTPKMEDLKVAENMPSETTYQKFFGSWNKALEVAGFSPNVRHDWTREELTELLIKFREKLGRTPTRRDVNAAEDMPSASTYQRFFGSWNKALEAAGFKPNVRHDWTEEKLIELLVKLGKKLGRTPKMEDLKAAEDMPSIKTCQRFFGSWNKALEAAGLK